MSSSTSVVSLADVLRARIISSGPITVADYMTAALLDPEYGYYVTKEPLGRAGDFITAPEISQVFGELIGLWCVHIWETIGKPDPLLLVEFGPGRGTLMADAIRAVGQASPEFAATIRVHLIEASPRLRARQNEKLRPYLAERLSFCADLSDIPDGPALFIANEFFDALPIEQFEHDNQCWRRRRVGLSEDVRSLVFVRGEECEPGVPAGLADAALGSVFELCTKGNQLVAAIAKRLVAEGGAALFIDYGYASSAYGDTLQAVRDHEKWPVLSAPGTADVTHHVDFEALRVAAKTAGGQVFGPVPQGLFLGRLGIEERARTLSAGSTMTKADAIMAGVHRLVHPRRMGLLFQAIAVTDPALPPPPGF